MPEMVDASTLSDPDRVRQTELAAAHTAALRSGDADEVAKAEKAIAAEYSGEPKAEPKAGK